MTLGTTKVPQNLDFCGGELKNFKLQNLTAAPENFVESMPYYDTVNHVPKYHNGTSLVEFGRIYSPGTGINISANNEISVASTVMLKTSLSIDTGSTQYLSYNSSTGKISIAVSSSMGSITEREDELVNGIAVYDYIQNELNNYILSATKGAVNGVASLGSDGKVPSSQLPAFVDDVIDLLTVASSAPATCATGDKYYNSTSTKIFTATGTNTWGTTGATPVSDVIYVATDTNATYRWSGSTMVNISNPIGQATESAAGIAEIATNTEVTTGTDDTRFVTPKKLADNYQGKLTQSTGITLSGNTISVTDYAKLLQNNATTSNAISILGTAGGSGNSVNIGITSLASTGCVAIGYNSQVSGANSIGIGRKANVSAAKSIQIGPGTNSTESSLSVGFYTSGTSSNNYILLDGTTGLIPDARISSSIKKLKYAADNPALTASGGAASWEITHGLGTDDVHLVVKEISTGEIIFPAWSISSGKVTITFLASANISAGTYRAIIMG